MIVGCYVLDLYCDSGRKDKDHAGILGHVTGHLLRPAQITAEHGSQARATARKRGWLLKRDGTAICPSCRASEKEEARHA